MLSVETGGCFTVGIAKRMVHQRVLLCSLICEVLAAGTIIVGLVLIVVFSVLALLPTSIPHPVTGTHLVRGGV